MYFHRELESTLARHLAHFPIVGIAGPRQSGKSTMLLRTLGEDYEYVTFDEFSTLQIFQEDPERFLRLHPGPLV